VAWHLRLKLALAGLTGLASVMAAQPVWATDWIPIHTPNQPQGVSQAIDLGGITRTANIAHVWVRQIFATPQVDAHTGKPYVGLLTERFVDCVQALMRYQSFVELGGDGATVRSGAFSPQAWAGAAPGSGQEVTIRISCRASEPKPKAFLDDIRQGDWTFMSRTENGSEAISVRSDGVVRLTPDHVVINSRSDFTPPTAVDGIPISHIVSAIVIDCTKAQWAMYGADDYVGEVFRVSSRRANPLALEFKPIDPGSVLDKSYPRFCKDAQLMPGVTVGVQPTPPPPSFSLGTAWATDKGYLVTADHVVDGGRTIQVYSDGQLVGSAHVVADDPINDLAVLKFTPSPHRALVVLPLAPRTPVLGKSVFTLGYPAPVVMGQGVKMTSGEVSSTAGIADDVRTLQISVPIQPGNSGGPLMGWDGAVIGVIESKLTTLHPDGSADAEEQKPENVNYALKISYLRPLLEGLPDLGGYVVVKPAETHDAMVAAARKAVFMLVVKVDKQ
jgi:S1-C subfamily serine protease